MPIVVLHMRLLTVYAHLVGRTLAEVEWLPGATKLEMARA
jgi:hypothetical protein